MTIEAKIIADSIGEKAPRITTMQLKYPRFIHSEVMTHRVFSRNASSSRAIPVEKQIQMILDDPAMPVYWGSNKPGMQAGEELSEGAKIEAVDLWNEAKLQMIDKVHELVELGLHKQLANRLLEPWAHIQVVVTATKWSNFFALRRHPDAQPEIKVLADKMFEAMEGSEPILLKPSEWHLPYINSQTHADINTYFEREWVQQTGQHENDMPLSYQDEEWKEIAIKCSVARCARVSYLTHEGRTPDIEADLALYDRLVGSHPMHASPAEHQATPMDWEDCRDDGSPGFSQEWLGGNFTGWIQYRKTLPGESQ